MVLRIFLMLPAMGSIGRCEGTMRLSWSFFPLMAQPDWFRWTTTLPHLRHLSFLADRVSEMPNCLRFGLSNFSHSIHSRRSPEMLHSPAPRNFSPMRLRDRLERQHYEQKLQETRWERKAEIKQVERLSAILVKKAGSAKIKGLTDRVA